MNDNYLDLRNAIISQAISDYRKATRYIEKWRDKPRITYDQELKFRKNERMVKDVEIFFRSVWARQLCGDIDPMMILGRLRDDERAAEAHKAVGQAH